MNSWFGLKGPLGWLAQRFLMLWVKTTVLPDDLEELTLDRDKPIFYVLDLDGISNTLVLREVCHELGLPDSGGKLAQFDGDLPALIFLRRLRGVMVRRADPTISSELNAIVKQFDPAVHDDVQIVPVSIIWGRAPQKEESLFKLLFSDSWSIAGRLRKLMIILLHGRHTLVQFSKPASLRELAESTDQPALLPRKLNRLLRVHFRRLKEAAIGPDLSHRRLLVNEIVDSDDVRDAIEVEAAASELPLDQARNEARANAVKYAKEIAADYSHPVIRVLESLLTWVWNSLYHGIQVNNFAAVHEVARGNEIIYVPCHRSHADYLLLSYVLYKRGLVPPHIAAGINLNLPVVGAILRRCGAFFIRRSFHGQKLYSTVFDAYLRRNLSKGVALEYFIEGTRSRSGKLLDAKGGMLSMTVNSYLKDKVRSIVFVPVYFGYERLLEGRSYERELSGAKKQKESVWGLFKSLKILRRNYGQVYVNFSDPLHLEDLLETTVDNWSEVQNDPEQYGDITKAIVAPLGQEILISINRSAAINPVNMLGLILQAADNQALSEKALAAQINLYVSLLKRAPYSPLVTLGEELLDDDDPGSEVIEYGEEFSLLVRQEHSLGDVIAVHPHNGRLIGYYRNNVKHIFALSSLIAICFMTRRSLARASVVGFVQSVYSLARGEYYLQLEPDEVGPQIDHTLDTMIELGVVLVEPGNEKTLRRPGSDTNEVRQLDLLAHIYYATIERYSMIVDLILETPSGEVRQSGVEEKSRLAIEQLALLNENAESDYFDVRAFRRVLRSLLASEAVWRKEDRKLCYDEELQRIGRLMNLVIDVPARRVSMHP